MTNIEITNMILEFFIKRGIKTEIDVSIDDKDGTYVAPQIQINVDFIGRLSEQFSFFYATDDPAINFAVIYKMKQQIDDAKFHELADSIHSQIAPFKDIIKDDDDAHLIHLFREMKPNDFNEGVLDEILKLFTEKNEVIEKLRGMCN